MRDSKEEAPNRRDEGFTLVELLIVIVILGILATVTVFAVRGITDKGQTSACNTDKATLQTATEAYFANYGGTQIASQAVAAQTVGANTIPAVAAVTAPTGATWTEGANPAQTLVNAQLLRSLPSNYWIAQDGTLYISPTVAKCGTLAALVG